MEQAWIDLAEKLGQLCLAKDYLITTAESCTGGLVSAAMTSVSGSSDWFERGFVTYTNQAKQDMLNVPEATLQEFGAVSEQTARAMAEGALRHSHAHISAAVTGIAGPTGGSVKKPVGMVCFAYALSTPELKIIAKTVHFSGARHQVRAHAVSQVLTDVIALLQT